MEKPSNINFIVNFTYQDASKPGQFSNGFETQSQALEFVERNKEDLYWHEIVHAFPRSRFPRPIVTFEPGEEYDVFHGTLSTYFEAGMECLGLVFEKDGVWGSPNPAFNPNLPPGPNNFKNFSTYEALIFIAEGQILLLPDGTKLGVIKDREFGANDGFRLSFYPRGFTKQELLELFMKDNVQTKIWVRKKDL